MVRRRRLQQPAVADASGNALAIDTYDEYGIPGSGNIGRFQYTGQAWIPELGMYSYKARVYSPTLGRFMQTDPAWYPDGPNWYAYAMNDPVNGRDPTGLEDIVVTGSSGGYDFSSGDLGINTDYSNLAQNFAANVQAYGANMKAAQKKGGKQQSKPPCSVTQKQLQKIGAALGDAGTIATVGSLGAGGLSAIAGVAGIVTADPLLAYYGGQGVEYSAEGYKFATALSVAGEAVSALGRSYGSIDRQAINTAISTALGSKLNEHVASAMELALDKAEEAAGIGANDTGCHP